MNEVARGHSNSRPALRLSDAGEEPRLHGRDGADPRRWYRSEHRDFFGREQRAASSSGLPRVSAALLDPSRLVTDGEVLSLDSSEPAWFPDLAEGLPFLREHRDRRGRECRPICMRLAKCAEALANQRGRELTRAQTDAFAGIVRDAKRAKARQVVERHGRPERTRTVDLYRVK